MSLIYIGIYILTSHANTSYTHTCKSALFPFRTHYLPVLDETLKAVGCERLAELPSKPLPGHITGLCLKSWKNNSREEMSSLISERLCKIRARRSPLSIQLCKEAFE